MTITITLFIVLLSAVLTWWMRSLARKKAILDIPNHRSSHTLPTPRGGGVAVVTAFFVGIVLLLFQAEIDPRLFNALMIALIIAATGFWDDLSDLPASLRLAVQIGCAVAALYLLSFSGWLWIFALLLIVWFTNLFNFLDGTDGYVVSEVIFLGIAGWVLYHEMVFLILLAAAIGFLPFNWQKASIFMGDVGSTFLGFVTGVLLIYYAKDLTQLLIWLTLTLPFWFDATYTLIRRLLNKEKLTQAHRKHLFQRMVRSGMSHRMTALSLGFMNLFILTAVLLFSDSVMLVFLGTTIVMAAVSVWVERRVAFDA